jgi:S1-C subfamily serine protease
VNPFDVVALALIVVAILAGIRTGALQQAGGISGAVAGVLVAVNVAPWLVGVTADLEPIPRATVVLAAVIGAVLAGEIVGSGIGHAAAGAIYRGGVMSSVDRGIGGLLGAAQAVLIIWLVGGLLAAGPFPTLGREALHSTSVQAIATVLPPPTEVVDEVAAALDDSGLPDVFVGLEPIPLPTVDLPTEARSRSIARAAAGGTARLVARACSSQVTGTGVLVAREYLVTNAHVVAGASTVRASLGGDVLDATPVLFDPVLDVAVLHVPGLDGQLLRFASSDPERGARGVALGFAGGSTMVILPAAVSGAYPATGRDIYGGSRITRSILELRAAIEPGDSGGPLILEDGTVGGLVFAESKTDETIGYALTPTVVATRIAPAIGRTGAVGTGECLR